MAAAGSYTVTRQETDQYDFTNPGNPVLGTVVFFTTGAGNSGSIFVTPANYKEATIKTLLAAAAKNLDVVGGITGSY